jgi:acetyl esterase
VPLDPQIKGMLDLMAQLDSAPLSTLPAEVARAGFEQMTTGLRAPEQLTQVASTRDLTIPGPAGPMAARVYRPEAGDGGLPTVLFLHGGGWTVGNIETHDNQARTICALTGSVVVSLDYRLAPETKWPGAADDAWAAMQWVAGHVDELGADPTRLAVAGDSAGGNLAAVVAQLAKAAGLSLAAQLLIYPAVDIDAAAAYESRVANAEGYFLTSDDMYWFVNNYVPDGADAAVLADPKLSPLRSPDLGGLAPAVVLTAEYDPLRDEGEAYAAALEAAGVEVHLHRADGLIHGFFDLGVLSAAAEAAVKTGCAEFGALLNRR